MNQADFLLALTYSFTKIWVWKFHRNFEIWVLYFHDLSFLSHLTPCSTREYEPWNFLLVFTKSLTRIWVWKFHWNLEIWVLYFHDLLFLSHLTPWYTREYEPGRFFTHFYQITDQDMGMKISLKFWDSSPIFPWLIILEP